MNKPIISIITAVYNSELYLRECLDSVLSQDFDAWEMICIDDASIDMSGKILDYYASIDSRIKVFHQEHAGVSIARNRALDIAKGKLLCFLDSDDFYIRTDFLSIVLKAFENDENLELLSYNYQIIDFDKKIKSSPMPMEISLEYAKKSLLNRYDFGAFICQYVLKKDFMKGIRFPENRIYEDNIISFLFFDKVHNYKYIPTVFYAYRKHLSSLTAEDNYNRIDMILSLDKLFDSLDNEKSKKDLALFIISAIRGIFSYATKDIGFRYAYKHYLKLKKYISKYRKYFWLSESWDYKYKMMNFMTLYCPILSISLLYLKKNIKNLFT